MHTLRVLIVEDSADDAELVARSLRAVGYELTCRRVDTPQTMQAALAEPGWDLVLVDITLPHFNGLEALAMLRAKDPDLPVIVVSGTVGEDFAVQAMKGGANDLVLKNNLVRLSPAVERELAEAEVRRARRRAETELGTRLAQQEAIARLGQHALRISELGPLLDEAVASVARTLGVEYCKALELEPGGKALLLRAGVGWKEGLVGQATVGAGLDSQAGYTLSTRKPVIVEDLASETRFSGPALLREHGVVSGISTVIGNPDHPWGVLGAHTRSRRKFTGDDANFIQAAANLIAGAVERLLAEQALRLAQAYTRGLIEASVDAMLTVAKDLVITDVNEQMAKLTEMPKTMLIGSRFDACFSDPERAAAGVRQTLGEGVLTNYDLTLRAASGRELLVSVNASVLYDPAGKARGVFAIARDVTEQRRVERELRAQQNYSRGLIEASADALFAIDPELRITDVNEQTARFSGYPRAELTNSDFSSLFTEPERAAAGVRMALAEGVVKDYELVLRAADGREWPVSFNASTFKDDAGVVRGVFAAARDIAERRRLERERSLLASVVASATDAIYSYAPDTTVTSWNEGAERLYGYGAEEMIGRSMTVCVPLDRRAELFERMQRALRKEGIQRFETVRRRKDSSLAEVAISMAPIVDKAGAVSGIALIAREIGERRAVPAPECGASADDRAQPAAPGGAQDAAPQSAQARSRGRTAGRENAGAG